MKYPSRPHDISIRFPKEKKYLKKKLVKLAKENGISVCALMVKMIEIYLENEE
jgi:hypothetical protein